MPATNQAGHPPKLRGPENVSPHVPQSPPTARTQAVIQRKEIVGTEYKETRPTQSKVHPEVVDFLAEKVKAGGFDEEYELEVKNFGTPAQSLEDSHHRFVAGHKADKPFPLKAGGAGPIGEEDWRGVQYDERMFDFKKWRIMRGEYDHDKIQAALEELKTQVAEDASGVWGVTKFYELEQYNLSFVFRRDLNEDFWAWVDELEDEKKTAVEEFLAANGPDKEYKGPINEDDIGYGH